MLVLIDPESGNRGKIFLPPNSARSQLIWMPFSPTLIALFLPGAAMKHSREPARRRVLRELDRRLYQRGQAAMEARTDPNPVVNLDTAGPSATGHCRVRIAAMSHNANREDLSPAGSQYDATSTF